MRQVLLIGLCLVLFCGPAWAMEDKVLEDEALVEELSDGIDSATVVAAGVETQALQAFTLQLTSALEGSLTLVLDGSAIGEATRASDAELRERAKVLPTDALIVVRHTQQSKFVIARHLPAGAEPARFWTLDAPEFAPPVAQDESVRTRPDVSIATARRTGMRVRSQAQEVVESMELRQGILDQSAIFWEETSSFARFYLGRDREHLEVADVYRLLSMPEYASQVERNVRSRRVLAITGAASYALALGTGFIGTVMLAQCGTSCFSPWAFGLTGIGLAGGTALIVLSARMQPYPEPFQELRPRIDTYNRSLGH